MELVMQLIGFSLISGVFLALISFAISTGDKMLAAMMCFLFGPIGFLVLMAIEYSKTQATSINGFRYCKHCKAQLTSTELVCHRCKEPVV